MNSIKKSHTFISNFNVWNEPDHFNERSSQILSPSVIVSIVYQMFP